jgi:hypothetical protein
MPSDAPDRIWILGLPGGGTEDEDDDGDRSRLFRRDDAPLRREPVPVDRLQRSVADFVKAMGEAIAEVPSALAGYSIDTIEISAEVSAKGSVSLLGTGGEVAGKGGIAFTLKSVRTG